MTGRKPGYVCQTQNGLFRILHMYFYSCCPFSLLLLQTGSSGASRNANNLVFTFHFFLFDFFPPYFHAGVSCAEYFFSIVIRVFRHKREVERFEYLQAGILKCCNMAK